jgi:hypothetical protein
MRRIAFYSADERGLGHVRRSIAVAEAIPAARPTSTLLVAGGVRRPEPRIAVDTNGLARVPGLLDDLLAKPGRRAAREPSERRFTRLPARPVARVGSVPA